MFKCNVLACVKQSNGEHITFECDFLYFIMVKMRNTASHLMILKFELLHQKKAKTILSKSHLKQLIAECTALDCDFCCYVMAMRGEILYHIWCMPLKL